MARGDEAALAHQVGGAADVQQPGAVRFAGRHAVVGRAALALGQLLGLAGQHLRDAELAGAAGLRREQLDAHRRAIEVGRGVLPLRERLGVQVLLRTVLQRSDPQFHAGRQLHPIELKPQPEGAFDADIVAGHHARLARLQAGARAIGVVVGVMGQWNGLGARAHCRGGTSGDREPAAEGATKGFQRS
jgi:hypothetical protein